jgi:SAM-dependent methyltransferase
MAAAGPNPNLRPSTSGGSVRSGPLTGRTYADHLARYSFAAGVSQSGLVIDYGCGDGYGSLILAQDDSRFVVGLDTDIGALGRAKRKPVPRRNVEWRPTDELFTDYTEYEGKASTVVCLEVIEHLRGDALGIVVSRLVSCLAREGVLIISTPNWAVTKRYLSVSGRPLNPHHTRELEQRTFSDLLSRGGVGDMRWFGLCPCDCGPFESGITLVRGLLTVPLDRVIGRRVHRLPSPLRGFLFRLATLLQWVGSGRGPSDSNQWVVRPLADCPENYLLHLLVIGHRASGREGSNEKWN